MNWLAEKFVSVNRPLGDDPPVAHLCYGEGALESLQRLPDHSVHMVATSPPYWGLRNYGTEPVHWPEVAFSPMSGLPPLIVPAGDYNLGLEPTIEGYVGHLVAVFREVRRVLRGDGTFWLNLGDSYANDGKWGGSTGGKHASGLHGQTGIGRGKAITGLKPKDLIGIPWMVAFALRADGWYLRSDTIWEKGNPMPESVQDRPTRSHEYLFLFAHPESGGKYFYDVDAIREKISQSTMERFKDDPYKKRRPAGKSTDTFIGGESQCGVNSAGRNKRTVWTVNTSPYRGAHFATWPPKLVEHMIKAGTSKRGCCSVCGAPWYRVVTTCWKPTCNCNVGPCVICEGTGSFNGKTAGCARCAGTGKIPAPLKRAVVLDPFSGSATTGRVAFDLNRDFIGLDANSKYLDLAVARLCGEDPPQSEDSVLDTESVVDLLGDT